MTIKEFEIQYALGSLSDDDKIKVAGNRRTSKKILTVLSKDGYHHIRWCVADNPNTPKEVLAILSENDYFMYIRGRAVATLSTKGIV